MSKLVIVDASSILFRSFYGVPNMTNKKGDNIGGIYGFINQILNLSQLYRPHYFVVALDMKEKTWRHLESDLYKSTRKPAPEALIPQFAMLQEACDAFDIKYYNGNTCEADDWIASCVSCYKLSLDQIYIASTDKDLLQLVTDNVCVYDPFKRKEICINDVLSHWQVLPEQIVDLLALIGDVSDGIPGAKGVGLQTASKWLKEYHDLDSIFMNIDKLKPNSRRIGLIESKDIVYQAKNLITLRFNLEVLPIEACKFKPSYNKIIDFLNMHDILLHAKAKRIINGGVL